MAYTYNPKRILDEGTLTVGYCVNTTGDRWFIPGYPDPNVPIDMPDNLAECQELSPYGAQFLEGGSFPAPEGSTYFTSQVVTGPSVPPGEATDGDLWYNTTAGQMMIYVNDGDSSQWVAL